MGEIEHGTYSGYRLHYYYGGKPCSACRQAKLEYTRLAAARKRNGWRPGAHVPAVRCAPGLGWPEKARRG